VERDSVGRNAAAPTATVARVTAVLDAFLENGASMGVTELATRLGLAKSVVHRLVTALVGAGYLDHDASTRQYGLGPKAVRLGLIAAGQIDIREKAGPVLHELAQRTAETATLSLLVGDQRVYAAQVESTQPVRQSVQVGSTAHLYVGASGKAMLAFLSGPRRTSVLRSAAATGVTLANGARLDCEALANELETIRRRGFATSEAERVRGAASAAAPVFDHRGGVVGAISVAGVTVRHGPAELEEFGKLARESAERLSVELGWGGRGALARTAS
jgi:IclR family transcriptional regulator, acetate operon repressor